MLLLTKPSAAPLLFLATAQAAQRTPAPSPCPDGEYTLSAPGITASFIPYGASLTNLYLPSAHNTTLDVVLGFDNASTYSRSAWHPHLTGVPWRYANRIRNGTFSIDGETFHTDLNHNRGLDTLHGGGEGWDWRIWDVVSHTTDSITFSLVDPDSKEGFPGEVVAEVTYRLTPHQWHIRMTARATEVKTPVMLTSHTYWNLDGWRNTGSAGLVGEHELRMSWAGRRVGVDGILVPTGEILQNEEGGVFDFWSAPKQIGQDLGSDGLEGACGTGCKGYDTCFIFSGSVGCDDGNWRERAVATLKSPWSGCQMDVYTNQQALQVYSCNNMNGTFPLMETQGFFEDAERPRTVQKYGCVVLEVEDWIDGINHPGWGREGRQVFGPGEGGMCFRRCMIFRWIGR
ncbi:uncharacterized protein LTR77_000567 [Saxophila tyrrhenica]|uniref:Aldose 1-epimerase n=1 Tax=Saxophila tyrrhenica TaxID=1690608 RepID=A0AAV9PQB0_9PEZI|nr:hypothetical protein LTR77_000567 [Saxophila tyrrhenica]